MIQLDPRTTALILIDLQQGIVANDLAPRDGAEVVETAKTLAERFRAAGAPVFAVHVGWASGAEMPSRAVDQPMRVPPDGTPPEFSAFVPGLVQPEDTVILKHHWGAFTGTDLDLRLRRLHVRTVVVAGIATNMGVESTVRSAWELSYDVVVAEDACTSRQAEWHRFAVDNILPQIARVVAASEVTLARD